MRTSHLLRRAALLALIPLTLLAGCGPRVEEPTAATPADDVGARIAQAQELLGKNEPAAAAELLEGVVETAADNAQAWMLLATAQRSADNLERARQAYERAHDFPVNRAGAVTGLILVHVAKDERDLAHEWLEKARVTPGVDLGSLALRDELQELAGDERFAVLFPAPEVYERSPFVEDVRVIHEWRGETGEAFGWEARAIGDVDGDGVQDAVVSAPANSPPGDNTGRVDVYSGRGGELLWQARGESGDQLGVGVEAAHDVDGDGIPDVVAGAPGRGAAYVYSGPDGRVIHTFQAPEGAGRFGSKVAGVGDVDGDGHGDLLVGAPGTGSDPNDPGKAYLYSGRDGSRLLELTGDKAGDGFGTSVAGGRQGDRFWLVVGAPNAGAEQKGQVKVYTALDGKPAFTIDAEASAWRLGGMFLSMVGDVDGDRVLDVYASDWLDTAKGAWTGRIYVHSGKTGERLLTLTGEDAGDGFGIGPARAGDLDDDGADDLVIGAWQHGSAAFSGGKVYVYSGRTGGLLGAITCRVPGDTFGFDADGLGDVDGDGVGDLLVTSAWSMVSGPRSGRTFVISGAGVLN